MTARTTPYWSEAIEQAKERKAAGREAFTDEQQTLSGDFVTCACGRQDPRIPRYSTGPPVDEELEHLGMEFYFAVSDDDPKRAEVVLLRIEQRAAEVLAEVLR